MKFYITGETYRKLKNVFTNLNTFYIIDVDTLIKDSGLNLDVYYSYITRKYKAVIAKILVKNKSFIVNPDVYKDIKHNKLIQILCKK